VRKSSTLTGFPLALKFGINVTFPLRSARCAIGAPVQDAPSPPPTTFPPLLLLLLLLLPTTMLCVSAVVRPDGVWRNARAKVTHAPSPVRHDQPNA